MHYIINSKGSVLFRSTNLPKLQAKALLINTNGFGGKVTITDTKPITPKTKYHTILSYNDPVEGD